DDAGDAGGSAREEHATDPLAARLRRDDGSGALDPDGELLGALGDEVAEVAALAVPVGPALDDLLGLVRGEAALALERLAQPAGAEGDVADEDGDAVVEHVHVGGLVPDVDERDHAAVDVGVVAAEGVMERERLDVDDRRREDRKSVV